MSESYTIQNSTIYSTIIDTTVSRFTRDTLINPHDAYMTVELYNNYYQELKLLLLHMYDIACMLTHAAGVIVECSE